LLALGLLAGVNLVGADATACGGLFCDAAQPVNQAAERIIFAQNDDGTVTAVIEIQYEGPSESFAWVLPVPAGEVDVGVSSQVALDRIEAQSNPSYLLNVTTDDSCFADDDSGDDGDFAVGSPSGEAGSPSDDGGVEVVASGTAGPYDYEQIMVDADLEDPAQVAVDWLVSNGYDLGELGPDLLRPYLEQEMNLLAFRLTKGNEAGSIRPVMISYESAQPFIPIRPTAVAANPDMGIKVWVLGDSRAIPQNYLHLELNEARIDWFNPNGTYNNVVTEAANEAGGQGFVTEQAGPAGNFSEAAFATWEQDNWDSLRTGQFQSLEEFFSSAVNVFGSYDGFVDLIGDPATVPLRDGATAAQFIGCVSCYFQIDVPVRNDAYPPTPYDPEADPIIAVDVQGFIAEMDRLVITPLSDTRAMFDSNSMVTRFYTTMSADEMTADPAFEFNPELEDVSNAHTATQVLLCEAEIDWRIELAQGLTVEGNGRTWPIAENSEMPFNLRVLQLSTSGQGDIVTDNALDVGQMLTDLGIGGGDPEVLVPSPGEGVDESDDPPADDPPSSDDDAVGEGSDAGLAADEAVDAEAEDPEAEDPEAEDPDVDDAEADDVEADDAEANDAEADDAEADDAEADDAEANEAGADDESVASADDDGCGCSVVGEERSTGAFGWLGLLGLALIARRRR
jgi:MYXO-CTERM domain-containing protein